MFPHFWFHKTHLQYLVFGVIFSCHSEKKTRHIAAPEHHDGETVLWKILKKKHRSFGGLDDIGWVEVRFGVVGVMSSTSPVTRIEEMKVGIVIPQDRHDIHF